MNVRAETNGGRPRCQARTQGKWPRGTGQCKLTATYTDGKCVYCARHSRDYPTVLAKSTGTIRPGLTPINSNT